MSALTTTKARSMAPATVSEAMQLSDMLARSAMVPAAFKGKPQDVFVAVMWGAEVGLGPLQALNGISVINGKPALWGDAALALVRGHPACAGIREGIEGEGDARYGFCEVTRKGQAPERRTFSVADAKKAGLWGKSGPWQQYPDRMLQMRARGFAIRDVFPDALRGVITAEEAQDYPEPRDVPNMAEAPRPAGPLAQLQAPTDETLTVLDQDGVEHAIRASKSNPAVMIWMSACRKALAKLEDAAAVREWRAAMGGHLAEIAGTYPDEVAAVEQACEARLAALAPPDDEIPGEPAGDDLGLPE